jgi:dTDP-4-amino-4,6-dideoxygalactose transaminase
MKIPVAKPFLGKEEAQAAYDTILSHWVTQGPRVAEFEEKFSRKFGCEDAVAVSSCTTGLHLALVLCNIGPGDEVICPSMSFIATANSIAYTGATPVLAEVGPDYNLDLRDVEKRITPNTKAILLVHQIGMPAAIDEFKQLCNDRGITLIEDAACAIGSKYKGQFIGSHSDLVIFSFHPRKLLTTGDGGMIAINKKEFVERAKILRQHAMSVNDRVRHESNQVIFEDYLELGYNYRLTDIQAAVGIHQLDRLDWILEERRKIASQYNSALEGYPFIRIPQDTEETRTNFQSYCLYLTKDCPVSRNDLMQQLLDLGISTRKGVMNTHRTTAYRSQGLSFPVSEDLEDRSIILPLYVPMNADEVNYVISNLRDILGS